MLNNSGRTDSGNTFMWSFWSLAVSVQPEESKVRPRGIADDRLGVSSVSHDSSKGQHLILTGPLKKIKH